MERLEGIDEERLKVLEFAREQAHQDLEDLQQRIRALRRETQQTDQEPAQKKWLLRKEAQELEKRLSAPLESEIHKFIAPRPLRKGDRVRLRSLNKDGVLIEVGDEEVVMMVGKMRIKADIRQIERSALSNGSGVEESERQGATALLAARPSPGIELHLRGMRAEEACLRLEKYLEDAYAAGMPYVRIVHGKGSGALRQAVRRALSESQLVKRWENALDNEGGEGVTVAHIQLD